MGDGWDGLSYLEGVKKATWKLYIGSKKHPLGTLGVENILKRQGKHVDT